MSRLAVASCHTPKSRARRKSVESSICTVSSHVTLIREYCRMYSTIVCSWHKDYNKSVLAIGSKSQDCKRCDNHQIQGQERHQTRCVLSPMLFNIVYLECFFREALENEDVGIQVNGKQTVGLCFFFARWVSIETQNF